VQIIKENLH
jgi:hypothetical protein